MASAVVVPNYFDGDSTEEEEDNDEEEELASSTGSSAVFEELIVGPSVVPTPNDEQQNDNVDQLHLLGSIEGLADVACVPRPPHGRGQVVVHERDAHDFWNLRRWAVVPSLLLYRYDANDDSRPFGVCDLEKSEVEASGSDLLRLWVDGQVAVEARFLNEDARRLWRERAFSSSLSFAAAEIETAREQAQAAREEVTRVNEDVAAARDAAGRAEAAAEANSARAGELSRTLEVLEGILERSRLESDAALADSASLRALLCEANAALASSTDAFARENAALKTKVAGLEASLAEQKADRAQRDIVDTAARKKTTAERKLMVREIKDLRRCLKRGATAKDATDQVKSFWDVEDDDHQDEDAAWLLTELLRRDEEDDDLSAAKEDVDRSSEKQKDVVVSVRDLSSGDKMSLTSKQLRPALPDKDFLTPEQIAFDDERRRLEEEAGARPLKAATNALRDYVRGHFVKS